MFRSGVMLDGLINVIHRHFWITLTYFRRKECETLIDQDHDIRHVQKLARNILYFPGFFQSLYFYI